MTAPEKVKSGIEGLDRALSNIRLGDNVVWRLKSLDLFPLVAAPFVKQAVSDGRNLIYLRFAPHEEFVPEQSGVKRYELDPEQGFDAFTSAVHDIIAAEGPRAFYVFDSLSALQVAWNTDAHTGDFFHATCPFLYANWGQSLICSPCPLFADSPNGRSDCFQERGVKSTRLGATRPDQW